MKAEKFRSFAGLDIGTSRLVVARPQGAVTHVEQRLNAFIEIPDMPATVKSLTRQQIQFIRHGGSLLAYGDPAATFAELFHADLRRPMRNGCLDLQEPASLPILTKMLTELLGEATVRPAAVGFSLPSASLTASGVSAANLTNHRHAIERVLRNLGYEPFAVAEGEALIYSELENTGYSGLAISFGAGLSNVAMTYLSVPVLDFSVASGGDSIDQKTAEVLGEKATRVRLFKESDFHMDGTSDDPMSRTLRVFYAELIQQVVGGLSSVLVNTQDVPRLKEPVPVVLGGGGTLPGGFAATFQRALKGFEWPFPIREVRQARDPLNAVAKGVLHYVRVNQGEGDEPADQQTQVTTSSQFSQSSGN